MGGHVCRPSVVAQAANFVSVQLGGDGWRRSRDKDKYSDKYQMSGVRWCSLVGVAYLPQYGCQPVQPYRMAWQGQLGPAILRRIFAWSRKCCTYQ
uniref:Uncharacterized protein n=1 Tax=Ficus carica TaxID=3494 RepID=A0AA88ED08_FICCA|nr:hypothetical protein TIFTF001_056018 [Ficus carica]GMN72542.1 hypothetical protein TIFTF001_056020 [Ficus carica]